MKKLHLVSSFCIALYFLSGCSENNEPTPPDEIIEGEPQVTGFSPVSGPEGKKITIFGANFLAAFTSNIVKFNGTPAVVTGASATFLIVNVPPGATTGKVTVEVAKKIATSPNDFEVLSLESIVQVTTLAGNGTLGLVNGSGADARLYQPTGLALDGSGNLFVADAGNHVIRKISAAGEVTTFAGDGTPGLADGISTAAQFNSPRGIAIDASDNLYVVDGGSNRIRKITSAGIVTTLAGTGEAGFEDGPGSSAQFFFPKGIAIDAAGNLYVADDINQRIRKITPDGNVTTFAGSTSGSEDGSGDVARFNSPRAVAVDVDGNVYVADTGNHRIRKFTANGVVSTVTGSQQGIVDGNVANARFNTPEGVAVDAAGNVFVADKRNQRIRQIAKDGTVTTLAGGFLSSLTDGPADVAEFNDPTGIAVDGSGVIFIADRQNHSIRKID